MLERDHAATGRTFNLLGLFLCRMREAEHCGRAMTSTIRFIAM